MARPRLYQNNAQRYRAYRARLKERLAPGETPAAPKRNLRKVSRPARLKKVQEELEKLMQEYSDWLVALPEALEESAMAEQLEQTIEQLQEVLDNLESIELPRGYGR
jgi:hypothetical protein